MRAFVSFHFSNLAFYLIRSSDIFRTLRMLTLHSYKPSDFPTSQTLIAIAINKLTDKLLILPVYYFPLPESNKFWKKNRKLKMMVEKDLDIGMRCIKYMLCAANLMFVIVGLLLISIGYTIRSIYGNFEEFMEAHYYNPSTLAIIVGFFIFTLALFGCIGAMKQSTCLVNTYAFFLTLVLVLEMSVCIASYAMRTSIEDSIRRNMEFAMKNLDIEYNAFTWNSTQYNLQCCGINDFTDWSNVNSSLLVEFEMDNTTISVPATCCFQEQCSSANLYNHGCLYRLSYIVSQCASLLAVGALCVAFIQVLGIVFAAMLAKSIRKVKTQMLVAREERRRNFYDQMVKSQEKLEKSPELYTPMDSEA